MNAYIDINDDHELYVWARIFQVTPQELVRLVSEFGPSADRIRDALERSEGGKTHST